uniref:Ig-like domain-containing protein n=1 Tax=Catharus ustulatus TaxID=91951 RepID=A0A8C3TX97_CATUS
MRRNRKIKVEKAAELMCGFPFVVKPFEMEIIPAEKIVAQIGDTLILTCNTTGCPSPVFSWRTQMDSPLGGKVSSYRTHSILTMNPVSIVNSHSYLCTVICDGREKKEKSVKVQIYCK